MAASFEWDSAKATANLAKHGVAFSEAQLAFFDVQRVIARDQRHSRTEQRFYCFGKVGDGVMTVRFTYRDEVIRIIGAGYWRQGQKIYETQNQIHE